MDRPAPPLTAAPLTYTRPRRRDLLGPTQTGPRLRPEQDVAAPRACLRSGLMSLEKASSARSWSHANVESARQVALQNSSQCSFGAWSAFIKSLGVEDGLEFIRQNKFRQIFNLEDRVGVRAPALAGFPLLVVSVLSALRRRCRPCPGCPTCCSRRRAWTSRLDGVQLSLPCFSRRYGHAAMAHAVFLDRFATRRVAALLDSVWECLFACACKIVEHHASVLRTLAQCANEQTGYRSRYRPRSRQSGNSTSLALGRRAVNVTGRQRWNFPQSAVTLTLDLDHRFSSLAACHSSWRPDLLRVDRPSNG